jgi:hypothetical protein
MYLLILLLAVKYTEKTVNKGELRPPLLPHVSDE